MIFSDSYSSSPNHTTPGLASAPHFEQRGSSLSGMSGSNSCCPASTSFSVPASAGQMGESEFIFTCSQAGSVHNTLNSLPCISIMDGLSTSASGGALILFRDRRLRPSTFCVMSVNVERGAISSRIAGIENLARAKCAALGCAARALYLTIKIKINAVMKQPLKVQVHAHFAAIVIELPHSRRVSFERLGSGKTHGIILAPHSTRTSECQYT